MFSRDKNQFGLKRKRFFDGSTIEVAVLAVKGTLVNSTQKMDFLVSY